MQANISAKTRSATMDLLRVSIANFDEDPAVEHVTLTGRPLDADVFDKVLRAMYALLSKDPYVRWKIIQQKKLEEPVREVRARAAEHIRNFASFVWTASCRFAFVTL